MPSRRQVVASLLPVLCAGPRLWGQAAAPTTRPNIGEIDRVAILAAAATALGRPVDADFVAVLADVPALAAAAQIDAARAAEYRAKATEVLGRWFVAPMSRLATSADAGEIVGRAGLAEVVVALPFLGLEPGLMAGLKGWFAEYLAFLITDRGAMLTRDARDHAASAWLLQVSAVARLLGNDKTLDDARHRFRTVTIRAQINADGYFPHELTTEYPLRNSLFNLDLLAGVCQLLSTRFESVWDYELQDGPGMRGTIARHAPYLRDRATWPYRADTSLFQKIPLRRPALVLAARAYQQADYATLWRNLEDKPLEPALAATVPIRQPLLWLAQPRRVASAD